jgi:nucleotide-binding universal stress UspA family protein
VLGSVAEKVIRQSPVPVLTAKSKAMEEIAP